MGIFKTLFGKNEASNNQEIIQWKPLIESSQLDEIIEKSHTKTQAIFKHSTRCGISSGVLKQFERNKKTPEVDFYYLDLLSFRSISNEIATKFNVHHQSPQLLIFKNGKVIAHDSHYEIMSLDLT